MPDTITLICSIVLCIIGVLTFVASMNSKSKGDGVLVQKIDQALTGIEELKTDLKEVTSNERNLELLVRSHEEQIKTLFAMFNSSNLTTEALTEILHTLKHMNEVIFNEKQSS